MSHSVTFAFKQAPVYRKGVGGRNLYSAVASTATMDRDREVLIPKGVIIDSFMKNPVMLNIHQMKQVPVGRVVSIQVAEEMITFDFEFYDDEPSAAIERMYQTGFMNAFSVGFLPKAYIPTWNLDEGITSIAVELPDGTSRTVDLSQYDPKPWGIIPQWELLEISPVPVPSNPDALLQRSADELVRKSLTRNGLQSKAVSQLVESKVGKQLADLTAQLDSFLKQADNPLILSSVVEYEPCEAKDTELVGIDALTSIAVACSADGSGDSEQMNWAEFSRAFGWIDLKHADSFTAYKFQHHVYKDTFLMLSESGLRSAMKDVLASTCADKKSVYDHLAKHYKDLGWAPPEFKDGDDAYTADQLALIGDGKDPEVESTQDPAPEIKSDPAVESDIKALVKEAMDSFSLELKDLNTSFKIRMTVVVRMLEELSASVLALQSPAKSSDSVDPPTPESKTPEFDLSATLGQLQDLFKTNLEV